MNLDNTIIRCKRGDKEAFRELFESVEHKALATAYFLCRDKNLAEDILQETYIKCFTEIKSLKSSAAFQSWFFKILVRTGQSMCKKQSNIILCEITQENEALYFEKSRYDNNDINSYEVKKVIMDVVNSLSENLRTVVILYYYDDMSIEEISKITGVFKATVKSRLFYARAALVKKLKNCFEDEIESYETKFKECR